MHNLCVFCTFSTFSQTIFKGWGCNFTFRFSKVMCIKSLKMVFVARIVRHKLCMVYAFFDCFCSKIIFDQKLFSYCWKKFDYQGSIVYLSCYSVYIPTFTYLIYVCRNCIVWKSTLLHRQLGVSIVNTCTVVYISNWSCDIIQ